MITTAVTYKMVANNIDRSLRTAASAPQVARESDYYLKTVVKLKSVDEFVDNSRVFRFAMKAYGLEDMATAKAFMKKVLKEGVDSSDSFANKLSDPRYKEFAATFNFARYGSTATVFDRAQKGTVDRFVRQELEQTVGQTSEGARLALYFERKANSVTSVYHILADKQMIKVVQTALGLSPNTSYMPIDQQAKLIGSKLDISDLKDPKTLDKFLTRFASLWDLNSTDTTNSPTSILFGQTGSTISSGLLASLQNLKLGGN